MRKDRETNMTAEWINSTNPATVKLHFIFISWPLSGCLSVLIQTSFHLTLITIPRSHWNIRGKYWRFAMLVYVTSAAFHMQSFCMALKHFRITSVSKSLMGHFQQVIDSICISIAIPQGGWWSIALSRAAWIICISTCGDISSTKPTSRGWRWRLLSFDTIILHNGISAMSCFIEAVTNT